MERVGGMASLLLWSLHRYLRSGLRLLGWSGVAAIILMLIAAITLAASHYIRRECRELKQDQRQAEIQPAIDLRSEDTNTNASHLAQFRAVLGDPGAIPDLIKDLMSLGDKSGLELAKGEYRKEVDIAGGYFRYRITLPVEGKPDAVMGFVMSAVKQHRNLALETVNFHRERKDATVIQAQVNFVALMRMPGGELKTIADSRP